MMNGGSTMLDHELEKMEVERNPLSHTPSCQLGRAREEAHTP
jgi:hypothetical protein